MISTRNTKTTALAVSFSAIVSCEILHFGQQLSVCVRARQLNSYLASCGVRVIRLGDVCGCVCLHLYDVCGCVCACACVCLCMHVCVCLMCVCVAFRVMLNGMTKVDTPLLASSSSLGRPIGAPRVF